MTEIYDMVLMVGDLVLILVFFWFIAEAGLFFLDEFSMASSRIIQEFMSGYASMSSFAPSGFFAEGTFPAVNHMIKISENPPFIFLSAGTAGTARSNPMTGEEKTGVMITFVQKPPLPYFIFSDISPAGDCTDSFCTFSKETLNKIRISKNGNSILFSLNGDSK